MTSKKTILAFGTFDLFHQGHYYFFDSINEFIKTNIHHSYKLIVCLYSSAISYSKNGYLPIDSYNLRHRVLSHIPYINEIVYIDKPIQCYLDTLEPDIIAIGFNQHYIKEYLEKNYSKLALLEVPGYNTDLYITSELRIRKYAYKK